MSKRDAHHMDDFQVHTHYSDGGKSPEDLLVRAGMPGQQLRTLAFTDHDCTLAYTVGMRNLLHDTPGRLSRVTSARIRRGKIYTELADIPSEVDDKFVAYNDGWPLLKYHVKLKLGQFKMIAETYIVQATELKVRHEGGTLDLLAYFMPAYDEFFHRYFDAQTIERTLLANELVDKIRDRYGYDIHMGDVQQAQGFAGKMQRPHVARALLRLKQTGRIHKSDLPERTIDEVMDKRIGGHLIRAGPLSEDALPTLQDATERLIEIGAIPVLPWSGRLTRNGDMKPLESVVRNIIHWSDGNMGLEVCNLRHPEATAPMMQLAQSYQISVQTAGSDYHGLDYDPPDRCRFGVPIEPPLPTNMLERLIKARKRILNE